jgi:hypothetical protein
LLTGYALLFISLTLFALPSTFKPVWMLAGILMVMGLANGFLGNATGRLLIKINHQTTLEKGLFAAKYLSGGFGAALSTMILTAAVWQQRNFLLFNLSTAQLFKPFQITFGTLSLIPLIGSGIVIYSIIKKEIPKAR